MKKRIICLCTAMVMCGVTAFSAACTQPPEPSNGLTQTAYPLQNLSSEYIVEDTQLTTYYNGDSMMPYVGVEAFISAMEGVFDSSALRSTVFEEDNQYILQSTGDEIYILVADWQEDTITVSSYNFFYSFNQDTVATDYDANIQTVALWSTEDSAITLQKCAG